MRLACTTIRPYPANTAGISPPIGIADESVMTLEVRRPVAGSSAVSVVRLPVRLEERLNAYARSVFRSVTIASIHVPSVVATDALVLSDDNPYRAMAESPVSRTLLAVRAMAPRSSPVSVPASKPENPVVARESMRNTPSLGAKVTAWAADAVAGPVVPDWSSTESAASVRTMVPAPGPEFVAETVRVRPEPDTWMFDHPVEVPDSSKSAAVTPVTSSEKVTVHDCSFRSFGETFADAIDVTVGAVRSTILVSAWASPVSTTMMRPPESNVATARRPSALSARPHGDCEESEMFGLTVSAGVAVEKSTVRRVKLPRLATHAREPSGVNAMPIGLLSPVTVVVTALVAVLMTLTEPELMLATARRVPAPLMARWYGPEPTATVATTALVAVLMTVTEFELTFEV